LKPARNTMLHTGGIRVFAQMFPHDQAKHEIDAAVYSGHTGVTRQSGAEIDSRYDREVVPKHGQSLDLLGCISVNQYERLNALLLNEKQWLGGFSLVNKKPWPWN